MGWVVGRGIRLVLLLLCCTTALAASPGADRSTATQQAPAAAITRGPYLQLATPTSIVVRWRTDTATNSRVVYGAAPGDLWGTVLDSVLTTEHAVTVPALSPDTRYYYGVGSSTVLLAGDDAEHFFVTSPTTGATKPTRIWVVGDSGTGDASARAVRDAYYAYTGERHTDLWLMLGDNAYPSGTDAQYQSTLFNIYPTMLRHTVVWPTLGNHDGMSANSPTESGPYYDIFTLPRNAQAGGLASGTEAYYSFDYANVHFVVLDSFDTDRSPNGAMLTWLDQDLGATMQDWVVAFWHHPPYSKGSHDSDTESELIDMRENVVPILEAHGVDLTLSGHSHSYERSFFIDGHHGDSSTFGPAMLVDGGDGRPAGDGAYVKAALGGTPNSGMVHTVAGSSGQTSGGSLDHPAMFVSFNLLGSVVLDIAGERLDAVFLDSGGVVRDSFTLIKGCTEHPKFGSGDAASGSVVRTPGYCDQGPPCTSDLGTSVSSDFAGSFWMLGAGDPARDGGVDSGAFPALEGGVGNWITFDPPGPARLLGSWDLDARIDGCLGDVPAPRCMGMLLGDQRAAVGYFAMLSAEAGVTGDFSFAQSNAAPIALAALPRPTISGTSTINPYTVQVTAGVPSAPAAGMFLDGPTCDDGALVGYKIYEQRTARGGAAPVDRTRDDGDPASGWKLAVGGAGPNDEPRPIGSTSTLTLTCYTAVDVYLATSLVFESGFETPFVSQSTPPILCSSCAVDGDTDGACAMYLSGQPGPDCDDSNPTVYPGAPQLCGDGLNNNCSSASWPGLVGTNEYDDDGDLRDECAGDCNDANWSVWALPGEASNLKFSTTSRLDWLRPVPVGGISSSISYDTLRSSLPQGFASGVCVETNGADTTTTDTQTPLAGKLYYYLVRGENVCGAGPLGSGSNGIQQVGRNCP